MQRNWLNWIVVLLMFAALIGIVVAIYDFLNFGAWGLGFISLTIVCIMLAFIIT
jgi:hypothetical protein